VLLCWRDVKVLPRTNDVVPFDESRALRWILTAAILLVSIGVVIFAQRPDWLIRVAMIALAPLALFFSDKPTHRALVPALILILAVIAMFHGLGEGSLYDWDEAYYTQVTRELISSGQWGTLTFAGTQFWQKPPLYFWLTALVSNIGGLNEFTARFVSAASGVGVIALTWLFGTRLFSWAAGAGAALLLLAVEHKYFSQWYNFVGQGRSAMLETTLTFFVVLSLILVWEARRRPHLVSWIGISAGLAVMTKSWPALAALGLPLMYAMVTGNFRRQRRYWIIAIVLMTAVILPWHVWQLWTHGTPFLHDYFVVNVFGRMLGVVQQEPRGPFYYLDIVRKGFSYFAYAALLAFIWAIWTVRKKDAPQKSLLLIWITIPLVVFSLAATKLGWYIIFIYPALAILTAQALAELAGPRCAVAGVAVVMACLSFRLPTPVDGSPDVRQFANEVVKVVAPGDSIYVYSDRNCTAAGTMINYVQSGIWNIRPSFIYYLDRTLLCTNLDPKSAENSRDNYFLFDIRLLQGPANFDRVLFQREHFVLLGPGQSGRAMTASRSGLKKP
jgi:4-amino-4-deoxy-L-arabinose transferase-like glycosyltransferase